MLNIFAIPLHLVWKNNFMTVRFRITHFRKKDFLIAIFQDRQAGSSRSN